MRVRPTFRLTPRGRRTADACTGETSKAMHTVLERVPRGERGRIVEALESLARALEAL